MQAIISDVELLPRTAPLADRYDEISHWLARQGYEARYFAGCDDDSDWEVVFCPLARVPGLPTETYTFHGATRQALAMLLVRHVAPLPTP